MRRASRKASSRRSGRPSASSSESGSSTRAHAESLRRVSRALAARSCSGLPPSRRTPSAIPIVAGRPGRTDTMRAMSQEVDGSRIPELAAIARHALKAARDAGATEAEADVSLQKGLTATVRLGEVETVEYQRDRGLGVTVYFGKRKGSASTADLREEARCGKRWPKPAPSRAPHGAGRLLGSCRPRGSRARTFPSSISTTRGTSSRNRRSRSRATAEDAGRAVDARITNSEGSTISTHRGVRPLC